MQNFKPGTDVPVTFDLIDEAGAVLTPTALNWRVLDETDAVLQDWTAVTPLPPISEVTVSIPSLLTALTAPALRGLRTVELEVITASGAITLSEAVMLQGATVLAFGINSFQTYSQALLGSEDFIPEQLSGWAASDRERREKALTEAHGRILMLPISPRFDSSQSMLGADAQFVFGSGPTHLRNLTPAQLQTVHAPFLANLRTAQLVEADHILSQDPVQKARLEGGLLSMTVGESSQFFRPAKPLDLPVCSRAMKHLERWVRFGARIGRA